MLRAKSAAALINKDRLRRYTSLQEEGQACTETDNSFDAQVTFL